ncbi:hypothetical protein EGW08_013057 [Elysia chlorotica]|uniref:Radial spokehead-like protein n=1 Tax=Elysia chlorotica TaxID=188477 RepID=A0A3S0ZNP9_ELYCH|nr:hypothetical protein EGW08_013057 [Elysia chlorotica]
MYTTIALFRMPPQRNTLVDLLPRRSQSEAMEAELVDLLNDVDLNEADRAALYAKLELLRTSDESGVSLYDHLSELLAEVLTSPNPGQAVDNLERISERLKVTRVTSAGSKGSRYQGGVGPGLGSGADDSPLPVEREATFEGEMAMLKQAVGRERMQATRAPVLPASVAEKLSIIPDMMRQWHMFNMAGFGLPASDYTRLTLAMRKLVLDWPLKSIRFWGKILGIHKDYFVMETEFQDGDYESVTGSDDEDEEDNRKMAAASQNSDTLSKDVSICEDDDDEIRPVRKRPVSIPSEPHGTGTNAKVYFVCNEQSPYGRSGFGAENHATFPPFPGNEANYLRAQIARIASSTSISPIGYFKFDEEGAEEEEEHEETRDTYVRDEEFDGLPSRELSDPSLTCWVHHANYILPQGRTVWVNPVLAKRKGGQEGNEDEGEEDEDDDEEEERKEPDEPEPEFPQPLLIPISEDVDVGPTQAWLARLSSQFVPEHSPVAVTSVTWPGAVAVATDRGRFFENLYIGFGQKQLDSTQMEFPTGPEVTEQDDPTPGEEAAIRAAMKEQEEWQQTRGRRRGEGDDDDDDEDDDDEGDDEDGADFDDNDDD